MAQTRHELIDRLRTFVREEFPVARSRSLADDESLLGRGILDSLGVVTLASFVETEFDMVLSPDELVEEHFESLAALAALVERKRAERLRTG